MRSGSVPRCEETAQIVPRNRRKKSKRSRVGELNPRVRFSVSPHRRVSGRLNIAFFVKSVRKVRRKIVRPQKTRESAWIERSIKSIAAVATVDAKLVLCSAETPCLTASAKPVKIVQPRLRIEDRRAWTNPSVFLSSPILHPEIVHFVPLYARRRPEHWHI